MQSQRVRVPQAFSTASTHFETHVPCALGDTLDKMNYSVDPAKATPPVPCGQALFLSVGAGFSSNAGLPLTSDFTDAMLAARQFGSGPSRMIVDFLSEFVHDAFNLSRRAKAEDWPDLEDIFTCVDMSANSGHHLGGTFAPADLRTVRTGSSVANCSNA
jgi:hypothetical protein